MKQYEMLQDEYWYGFRVDHGDRFPLTRESDYVCQQRTDNNSLNQEAPFLVSSKGRYLFCDTAFDLTVRNGTITIENYNTEPCFGDGFGTLRGAYTAACKAHFKPVGMPPETFFRVPQYNTWIELNYNQNQEDVLKYAHSILEHGLPAGILMIDDNWNRYYGCWEFRKEAFPDPKAMTDELHRLGFYVMLWICPFVSPDSAEFRELREKRCLVVDYDGNVAVRRWWNGHSAILDFSNPDAVAWFREKTDHLMNDYGIDGFKFDAGDVKFYKDSDRSYGKVTATEQCKLWAQLGASYPFNEFRACFGMQGRPIVQRLCDKRHAWEGGMDLLIPDALAQGIAGFAYGCPDMIGGGDLCDFLPGATTLDEELFVRYAQCAALMPMMQFSAAPWRVLSPTHAQYCIEAGKLHTAFSDRIAALAKEASVTGEPIIRYLEYVFPNEGFETVRDCFMIGDDLLVTPVLEQGRTEREVRLPIGEWTGSDGNTYTGGQTVRISVSLASLFYFEKKKV